MPSRYIREGWNDSDRIRNAGESAEVLLLRLILVADDYARFDGRVSVIRNRCWPVEDEESRLPRPTAADVSTRLNTLSEMHLVVPYTVDGKPYLYIPNFLQRTRAIKSKYPDPPEDARHMTDKGPTVVGQVSGAWRTPDGHVPDTRPTHDGGPQAGSISVSSTLPTKNTTSTEQSKTQPVDKSAKSVQGGLTTSTPATPPKPAIGLKAPAAMTPEERERQGISTPPDDLMAPYRKVTRQPGDDKLELPTKASAKAPNGHPPDDWVESSEGIEQAGAQLGMQRLGKFEPDEDYASRIRARINLG